MIGCAIIYIFVVKLDFARANWKTKYQIEKLEFNSLVDTYVAAMHSCQNLNLWKLESKCSQTIAAGETKWSHTIHECNKTRLSITNISTIKTMATNANIFFLVNDIQNLNTIKPAHCPPMQFSSCVVNTIKQWKKSRNRWQHARIYGIILNFV